ncbi:MAG: glycosyl hydrolase family 5 [Flavobacterium sp. BFFFF1]|uniref:glycoside hydrolase family 5 protein n=1 Tax=Flavobacterium sp. BFFFF1 TaxID=2015557 RepID=UPI000BD6E006|nr:glycoside hydrolase family 5 protein [Flavobacterium sp. BFFFF1]OYU82088.1 MAG: glycosyl hydrolase family 5 [Flavobacterium sp. BFFFF1]
MKNILTLFIFFFLCKTYGQFVKEHGQLRVSGTQLVDQSGKALVLRGLSFGWHSYWPQFYNKKAVAWLKKDFSCTVVRAAMGVEQGDLSYIKDPVFATSKVEAVVDGAIKSDIYVIIDWHSHNINLEEAKRFFDKMSKKYGKYANVIYEVFNEPDEESWADVKAYSETVINIIRKNDPDNIILVGSPRWDQDIHLPAADPIKNQTNLMYTMHFYAGTHGKWLRDRTDEAIESGLPVFISECAGMEATGDGPLNLTAWQEYIDWMESRKLSWITWSVSSKEETCSILKASASSEGNWKDSDLKESGLRVREFLRKFNGKN